MKVKPSTKRRLVIALDAAVKMLQKRGYVGDAEGEHWITLKSGSAVQIDGEGNVMKGMGGKQEGVPIKEAAKNLSTENKAGSSSKTDSSPTATREAVYSAISKTGIEHNMRGSSDNPGAVKVNVPNKNEVKAAHEAAKAAGLHVGPISYNVDGGTFTASKNDDATNKKNAEEKSASNEATKTAAYNALSGAGVKHSMTGSSSTPGQFKVNVPNKNDVRTAVEAAKKAGLTVSPASYDVDGGTFTVTKGGTDAPAAKPTEPAKPAAPAKQPSAPAKAPASAPAAPAKPAEASSAGASEVKGALEKAGLSGSVEQTDQGLKVKGYNKEHLIKIRNLGKKLGYTPGLALGSVGPDGKSNLHMTFEKPSS